MADLVNMQQMEYDETYVKLKALHQEELRAIQDIIKDVKELSETDGGFYVEKISTKIKDLFGCIDKSVLTTLEQSFELTETVMDTYTSSVVSIDTACG